MLIIITVIMNLFVLLTLVFTSCVESTKQSNPVRPNLPVGEFKLNMKRIIPCDPGKKNKIQINMYLSKTSTSTSEFRGNFTLIGTTLDDNHFMKVAFDLKDSTGGWSENSVVFKRAKGCSTYQGFFRKPYLKALGHPPCPVLEGVYATTGFPATNMENVLTNIPKVFFYGSYRVRISIMTKKDEELGCLFVVADIMRPWET